MNAVFIHIPKTAGLYIQDALSLDLYRYPNRAKNKFKQNGIVTFGHLNYPRLLRKKIVSKEYDKSAFKFAFCRNPFDRAVSHYFYVKRKHPEILDGATFNEYISRLENYGATFQPQSVYVKGVELGFVGRFESLHYDLIRLSKILNRVIKKIKPCNTTEHDHYSTYYKKCTADKIREYYKEDFIRFGYSPCEICP